MARRRTFFFFASLTKIGTILIHSHRTAITVLAAVIFLFDKLREKRSVPLTKQPGSVCFKNPCGTTGASRRDSDIVFLALPPGVSRWKGRTFGTRLLRAGRDANTSDVPRTS